MPDFFKKMQKKVEKKKQTGNAERGAGAPGGAGRRRLGFLPVQASGTSLFHRRPKDSGDSSGDYQPRVFVF